MADVVLCAPSLAPASFTNADNAAETLPSEMPPKEFVCTKGVCGIELAGDTECEPAFCTAHDGHTLAVNRSFMTPGELGVNMFSPWGAQGPGLCSHAPAPVPLARPSPTGVAAPEENATDNCSWPPSIWSAWLETGVTTAAASGIAATEAPKLMGRRVPDRSTSCATLCIGLETGEPRLRAGLAGDWLPECAPTLTDGPWGKFSDSAM